MHELLILILHEHDLVGELAGQVDLNFQPFVFALVVYVGDIGVVYTMLDVGVRGVLEGGGRSEGCVRGRLVF